jgi:hypothetical protein
MMRLHGSFYILITTCLLLAACNSAASITTQLPPSPPFIPDLPLSTSTTAPMIVSTPTLFATAMQCDPFKVDYCIEKGLFFLTDPIAPPGKNLVDRSYPYGSTEGGTRETHHGVEFENASGTPVLAAANGTVYYAGNDETRKFSPWAAFYGNIVVIKHDLPDAPFNLLYTLYAHLSRITVNSGQSVRAGDTIGAVGMTGTAAGSHLHFELRLVPDDYFSTLNPELWLVPHPGDGALAILVESSDGTHIPPSFTLQYSSVRDLPPAAPTQVDSYSPETINPKDPLHEVAALGDAKAGWYRVSFLWAGILNERWVEVQPDRLTLMAFSVK